MTVFLSQKFPAKATLIAFATSLIVSGVVPGASALVTSASAITCTPVSQTGLVGHWTFDEGSGTTASDGSTHPATLSGTATFTPGGTPVISPNPSSLLFDGGTGMATVANSGDFAFPLSDFTVSAFVKVASAADANRSVLGNFSAAHRGWGLYLYNTNRVNFFGYGSAGTNDSSQPGVVLDNAWHHVTGVYKRSGASLTIDTYVDGVLAGSNTATVGDITASSDLLFGAYLGQPTYKGGLDDVRVYGRALTPAEVTSLSNGCGDIPACNGHDATVYVQGGIIVGGPDAGFPFAGTLRGTSGDDVIVGPPATATTVIGYGGNDTVCTGSKNDAIYTGAGNDWINAGDGKNSIYAGDGMNTVLSGAGNDSIATGAGNDTINAGDGNNSVSAGGGNDSVTTGAGNDSIDGGSGIDTCSAGGGFNAVANCEL